MVMDVQRIRSLSNTLMKFKNISKSSILASTEIT